MRLGQMLRAWRDANRYGTRETAKEIGVSAATLNRVERGENCDARSLTKIINWMFQEPRP